MVFINQDPTLDSPAFPPSQDTGLQSSSSSHDPPDHWLRESLVKLWGTTAFCQQHLLRSYLFISLKIKYVCLFRRIHWWCQMRQDMEDCVFDNGYLATAVVLGDQSLDLASSVILLIISTSHCTVLYCAAVHTAVTRYCTLRWYGWTMVSSCTHAALITGDLNWFHCLLMTWFMN